MAKVHPVKHLLMYYGIFPQSLTGWNFNKLLNKSGKTLPTKQTLISALKFQVELFRDRPKVQRQQKEIHCKGGGGVKGRFPFRGGGGGVCSKLIMNFLLLATLNFMDGPLIHQGVARLVIQNHSGTYRSRLSTSD